NSHDEEKPIIMDFSDAWLLHPTDDVAIARLDEAQNAGARYTVIPSTFLVTKEEITNRDIGVGDDVIFVGRFMPYDGVEINEPSVRFGNVSMMPKQPIPREDGTHQESFLIEARSLSGYSGSPVFFCERHGLGHRHILPEFDLRLLGIDWGHMHLNQPVLMQGGAMQHPDLVVQANSGMMGVVPAWKIQELLDHPALVAERNAIEDRIRRAKLNAPGKLD